MLILMHVFIVFMYVYCFMCLSLMYVLSYVYCFMCLLFYVYVFIVLCMCLLFYVYVFIVLCMCVLSSHISLHPKHEHEAPSEEGVRSSKTGVTDCSVGAGDQTWVL